jgi:hypothetical protein
MYWCGWFWRISQLCSSTYAVGVGGGEFWPFWNKSLQKASEIDGKVCYFSWIGYVFFLYLFSSSWVGKGFGHFFSWGFHKFFLSTLWHRVDWRTASSAGIETEGNSNATKEASGSHSQHLCPKDPSWSKRRACRQVFCECVNTSILVFFFGLPIQFFG